MVLEKTLARPLDCKEIQPIHPKGNHPWIFTGRTDVEAETPNTLATWCKELTHLKRSWCWERLRAGEGDDRGWDGWMASLTEWTWVWVDSRSWWWTGRPGVLGFMGLQRVRHNWVTELNWTELNVYLILCLSVSKSCPTLCDPMDCSSPGSSVHAILQARILEWIAIPFWRSSWPRDQNYLPCTGRWILNPWTVREIPIFFKINHGSNKLWFLPP